MKPTGAGDTTRAPTLDLHEIPDDGAQAETRTVLRHARAFGRPMPQAGREFLRRLTPHVDSAAGWWNAA